MKKRTLLLNPTPAQSQAVPLILGHDAETMTLDPGAPELPNFARLGKIDLVVGSPPIWVEDPDASCDDDFEDAVRVLKPEVFLLESVRGLMAPRCFHFLQDFADDLADIGYVVGFDQVTLGGKRRTVVIGRRDGEFPVLRVTHGHAATAIANLLRDNLNEGGAR